MRWFSDKEIVLFTEVVIDLYLVIMVRFLLTNVLTSVNVTLPHDDTRLKNTKIRYESKY